MTYRNVIYNLETPVHPWKFWTDGFKLIQKTKPMLITNNQHLGLNMKLYNPDKYRSNLSPDRFTNTDGHDRYNFDRSVEYDSTGLCLFKLEGDQFKLKNNIPNLFGDEMNQDTRLYHFDDSSSLHVTYNGFLLRRDQLHVDMLHRQLLLTPLVNEAFDPDRPLYLTAETTLLKGQHNSVEKNCILMENGDILYHVATGLTVETPKGQTIHHPAN